MGGMCSMVCNSPGHWKTPPSFCDTTRLKIQRCPSYPLTAVAVCTIFHSCCFYPKFLLWMLQLCSSFFPSWSSLHTIKYFKLYPEGRSLYYLHPGIVTGGAALADSSSVSSCAVVAFFFLTFCGPSYLKQLPRAYFPPKLLFYLSLHLEMFCYCPNNIFFE